MLYSYLDVQVVNEVLVPVLIQVQILVCIHEAQYEAHVHPVLRMIERDETEDVVGTQNELPEHI